MRSYTIVGITVLVAFTLSARSYPAYQIFEVQSTNCQLQDGYLRYENDTLRVVYMFWSEHGTMGIHIHNKSELPIYIDWKKCSFIVGEAKKDYWEDVTVTSSTGSSTRIGSAQEQGAAIASYWSTYFLSGSSWQSATANTRWMQQTFASSVSTISKPERITFIPPHVTIGQAAYALMPEGVSLHGDASVRGSLVDVIGSDGYHLSTIKIKIISSQFGVANSPLSFRSYLTYSLDEQFRTEVHVDSYFYVSAMMQIPSRAFPARPISSSGKQTKGNMWSSPSRFYIYVIP